MALQKSPFLITRCLQMKSDYLVIFFPVWNLTASKGHFHLLCLLLFKHCDYEHELISSRNVLGWIVRYILVNLREDTLFTSWHRKYVVAPLFGPKCWETVPITAVWADCQPDSLQCKTAGASHAPLKHKEDLCTSEASAPSPSFNGIGSAKAQPRPGGLQPL